MGEKMLIDLTYAISEEGCKYPSDPKPSITRKPAQRVEMYAHNKLWYQTKSAQTDLNIRTHHGTHIDAPAHKIPDGKTIDSYSIEKFVNPAIIIDLTEYCGNGFVEHITSAMLEEKMKDAKQAKAVVLRTGYDKVIEAGGHPDGIFPYMDEECAQYLSGLGLNILAIDSLAVDPRGSNSESHIALLEKDVLIAETLVNLQDLRDAAKQDVFELYSLPIKYENADAAQARVFAKIL
jgi:kynurenine formamidase